MTAFLDNLFLAFPLFSLVLLGWCLARWAGWGDEAARTLLRFVFGIGLPALLFRLMAGLSKLPPVDGRLLAAYFGSVFVVFALARLAGWKGFGMDGEAQSVFALGGVFPNNVMLGIPLARVLLGDAALPGVALVLVFNSLTLWTLVTVSVEWSRHGSVSPAGFAKVVKSVLTNPLVAAILLGSLFGSTRLELPAPVDRTLAMIGDAAAPLSLIALGMGIVEYGLREELGRSLAIVGFKLVAQPLVALGIALALGMGPMETAVAVLMTSLATGSNVYLMAQQFRTMQGAVAGAIVLGTALGAITTPLAITLVHLARG
ncbi:AEC family transporter [Derxia gummosa]|uniref:AEC family transporter n=1 Tax=Derxia gummosa DSM 723 TaxID=1121388 RepID=A0A8B6X5I4_9BURK|nr:AEC family transporter [Derxia gummosa]